MVDLFQLAAKHKYRFTSSKGELTVEDLFGLPLKPTSKSSASLNDVAIELSNQVETSSSKNFVDDTPVGNKHTSNKLEIVKTVIAFKKSEAAKAHKRTEDSQKREELLNTLRDIEKKELTSKSADEVRAMLASIGTSNSDEDDE